VAVETALRESPERRVLLHRVAQAGVGKRAAQASALLRPDISLTLSVDVTGQRTPILGANWTDSWDTNLLVTIGTSTTLFDSGESRRSVTIAEHDLSLASEGLEEFDRGLSVRVRELAENVRTAAYQVELETAESELAAEQARNARVSYENELITREEALAAEIGEKAAALELLVARYGLEFALIELERLCGCGIEELIQEG
jgi:outer membrane protein TolC